MAPAPLTERPEVHLILHSCTRCQVPYVARHINASPLPHATHTSRRRARSLGNAAKCLQPLPVFPLVHTELLTDGCSWH